ncbi:response regulator transcription factor [Oleiharenicola lentus]|uniref:response regulator transcription factor n=1 Tax=Oleiharenicola lentus TaxID=2508720 RepID=UPI003F66C9E2
MSPRVLVLDDHPLMRESLARLAVETLGAEIVGEAGTCLEGVALARRHLPDLIIVDVMLADGNGLDLLQTLRSELPATRFAVVSSFLDEDYATRARTAGAHGYACKEKPRSELAAMLRAACADGSTAPFAAHTTSVDPLAALSEREMGVFQLIGRGRSTREIAAALGISFKTAEVHRENIKRKLGLSNSVALVQRATLWVNTGRPA